MRGRRPTSLQLRLLLRRRVALELRPHLLVRVDPVQADLQVRRQPHENDVQRPDHKVDEACFHVPLLLHGRREHDRDGEAPLALQVRLLSRSAARGGGGQSRSGWARTPA